MSATLKEICVQRIYRLIREGQGDRLKSKLPAEISQDLYEKFEKPHWDFSLESEDTRYLENLLNLTHLKLSHRVLHSYEAALYRSMERVQSLILDNLYFQQHVVCFSPKYETRDPTTGEFTGYTVEVIRILKWILCQASFQTLEKLTLTGGGGNITFSPTDWIPEMARELPNLTYLSLGGTVIEEGSFTKICENLPQLRTLIIGYHHTVESFANISRLENLEDFRIVNVCFNSKDDFMEIFELKNLRKLTLTRSESFRQPLQAMQHLLDCKRELPALTFLDCAGNSISEQMIIHFAELNPRLEQICVMDTPLQAAEEIPTRNRQRLQLLSTGNLRSCLLFLNYHPVSDAETIDEFHSLKSRQALDSIYQTLTSREVDISDNEKMECLLTVLPRLREKELITQLFVLDILEILCSEDRLQMFFSDTVISTLIQELAESDAAIISLNRHLGELAAAGHSEFFEYISNDEESMRDLIWKLLGSISLTQLSVGNTEKLFFKTVDNLYDWEHVVGLGTRGWTLEDTASFDCIDVLEHCSQRLSKPFQTTCEIWKVFSTIESMLEAPKIERMHPKIIRLGFHLIEKCENINNKITEDFLFNVGERFTRFGCMCAIERNIEHLLMNSSFRSSSFEKALISVYFTVVHFWEGLQVIPREEVKRIREIHVNRISELLRNTLRKDFSLVLIAEVKSIRTFKLMKWAKMAIVNRNEPSNLFELEALKLYHSHSI